MFAICCRPSVCLSSVVCLRVGASLYMYDVVVKRFTFAISSPDDFLSLLVLDYSLVLYWLRKELQPTTFHLS